MASASSINNREQQIKEIMKCGRDPVYFMKNYAKIQHATRGLIPFETYQFQDDCIKAFEEHRFNIILKSRQLGLSTVTAAYCVWFAIFKKDKNVLIIATKLSTAMNFIKKVKTVLDGLPKWLVLTKFAPTKQSIQFSNGSNITAVPTSPDAGRSEALSLLIVDEAAFIREFEDIWTGLSPTISTGGSAIIISTPHGVGGQYYKLWTDAVASTNEFNPINLPWYVHPEHDQAWFDKETRNLSRRKIAQEFLCSFESSGDTFLQPEELDYLRECIEQPIRKEGPAAGIWIWGNPVSSRKYIISADVARGDATDYSTFHVIDVEESEVVAEYMGKIPPDKFADLLMTYGRQYNEAVLIPEKNTFGYFTCVKLRDAGYKRLFYKNTVGDLFSYVSKDPDAVPGFDTQASSRTQILAKLEETIRNRAIKVYSQRLFDQLQAFIWNGSKAMASKDSHDDLVISMAIGTWFATGATTVHEDGKEHAVAILAATGVSKRDISSTFNQISAVQPVMNPNMRGFTPQNVHKPRNASEVRHADVSDFSWLMR